MARIIKKKKKRNIIVSARKLADCKCGCHCGCCSCASENSTMNDASDGTYETGEESDR